MPYAIRKGTGAKPFKVISKASGKVVAAVATRAEALALVRERAPSRGSAKAAGR